MGQGQLSVWCVVYRGETWRLSGTFSSGTFSSGTFSSGTVSSGTFSSGTFSSGTFSSGTVSSGTFSSGTFPSGTFSSGTFCEARNFTLVPTSNNYSLRSSHCWTMQAVHEEKASEGDVWNGDRGARQGGKTHHLRV